MTDLDELMNKDPLSLSTVDIDAIIAYQRKFRAMREGGIKVKRGTDPSPKKKLTLESLGLLKPKAPDSAFKRRI